MAKPVSQLGPLLLGILTLPACSILAQAPQPSQQNQFPGFAATPATEAFPGITATPDMNALPGIAPSPMAPVPLAGRPSILALPHLEPGEVSESDNHLIADRHPEIVQEAARANLDLTSAAWKYQQVVCAALPDYVLLAYYQGPESEGSSRFVAILPRDRTPLHIVLPYAHGLLPFQGSWSRAGSFANYNRLLRHERGDSPLSNAPNWLLIGMCYAEITGYPVQVLSTLPNPDPTMDLLRLNANRPQMVVGPDQTADVAFSDVSRPGVTTNWNLHFNGKGEIASASREETRQAATATLKP